MASEACSPWLDGQAAAPLELVADPIRSGDQQSSGCIALPPGARQGPREWYTIDAGFEVTPSDGNDAGESVIELRVNGWAGIQMTLSRDVNGTYSVRGATTEGVIAPELQRLPGGRMAFSSRNYLPVDSVTGGESEISIVYSNFGVGVTYLAATSAIVRSTPHPPHPVVVGIHGIDERPTRGKSFGVSVVISTQRVDLTSEDMSVRVAGDGLAARDSGLPVMGSDGHSHTFSFEVSAHRRGPLAVTVEVSVPKLAFSDTLTSAVDVVSPTTFGPDTAHVLGLLAGLTMIAVGIRGVGMRRRRPRR